MSKRENQKQISERAERIEQTINYLQQKIADIKEEGAVAPIGCSVARYTAFMKKKSLLVLSTESGQSYFSQDHKSSGIFSLSTLGKSWN